MVGLFSMKTQITMLSALCLRTPTGPIHCKITGIFTHSGSYKIAVLQWTDFREGPVSSFFFVSFWFKQVMFVIIYSLSYF